MVVAARPGVKSGGGKEKISSPLTIAVIQSFNQPYVSAIKKAANEITFTVLCATNEQELRSFSLQL